MFWSITIGASESILKVRFSGMVEIFSAPCRDITSTRYSMSWVLIGVRSWKDASPSFNVVVFATSTLLANTRTTTSPRRGVCHGSISGNPSWTSTVIGESALR